MENCKCLVLKLLGKYEYRDKKDVLQNIFSVRCFVMIELFYSLVMALNYFGVFIVDDTVFLRGYLPSLVLAAVYAALLLAFGLEHPKMKYISITMIMVLVTIAAITLTYHVTVILMVPIVLSSMYTTKKLSVYTFVITLAGIVVSTYGGYFFGVCDANMALLTATTLDKVSEDGVFLLNQVNQHPLETVFLYYIVPRMFLATAFFLVSRNVYRMIVHSTESEIQMRRQAYTDEMTGLFNKNKLLETIQGQEFAGKQVAILYWDVNRLKYVNDTYGHIAGDILIQKVAQSVRAVCGAGCTAYRYGGDEFIMLVEGGTQEDADRIAAVWKEELSKLAKDCSYPVSAAVGTAAGNGSDLEKMISVADGRMYENKTWHRE